MNNWKVKLLNKDGEKQFLYVEALTESAAKTIAEDEANLTDALPGNDWIAQFGVVKK
ncbi:hypothetical protein TW1_030 [Pseudoalteromonas phage TW1]|uniref:hypothetical protein n=1 Tax=Pseudoalteromonas phage TW1 TaxID=1366055 RepID=UPI00035AAF99|nr:hypothetical protein PP585_gp30 [Pseudoalteromonas phage TW1]AGR46546.1 hypothetical protein TW1_030 [Pseudoalteromonas phage TW1]